MQRKALDSPLTPAEAKAAHPLLWGRLLIGLMLLSFLALFPLAFRNRGIYIDEAWIGEQVHALTHDGVILTNLFRDYPPLDQVIVVYHKLLVWLGAVASLLFGWGLYSLRSVSVTAGIMTTILLYRFLRRSDSHQIAVIGAAILLWTPLFWDQMRIFRPEMLATCCGFAGFVLLWKARSTGNTLTFVIAGVLSGMAGLAHPAGLAFAAAGCIALLAERRYLISVLFALSALIAFLPYISGLFTDKELFLRQLFDNGVMYTRQGFEWWQPAVNLLEEHKRVFRQPAVIGISVMFVLTLLMTRREEYRQRKFFWIYLATLFVLGALAPFPKITRYMLPLTPFFAIASARVIGGVVNEDVRRNRFIRVCFRFWVVVFILYGAFALGDAALVDSLAPMELETHRLFASKIQKGALVMAPPKFVFPAIDSFTIQSYWGARAAARDSLSIKFLEDYAARLGVRYLIVDPEVMRDWGFTEADLQSRFRIYRPQSLSRELQCHLLGRRVPYDPPEREAHILE